MAVRYHLQCVSLPFLPLWSLTPTGPHRLPFKSQNLWWIMRGSQESILSLYSGCHGKKKSLMTFKSKNYFKDLKYLKHWLNFRNRVTVWFLLRWLQVGPTTLYRNPVEVVITLRLIFTVEAVTLVHCNESVPPDIIEWPNLVLPKLRTM